MLRCTPESNYRGDADVDHTQTIGGNTIKLLGGISPPGFRHPCKCYRTYRQGADHKKVFAVETMCCVADRKAFLL